jgi:hypothetical protein
MASDDPSLWDYFAEVQRGHDKLHERDDAARAAALASLDKRLDSISESRRSWTEAQSKMVSRDFYDAHHAELIARVAQLELNSARSESVDANFEEIRRVRRTLILTIVGGVILAIATFGLDLLLGIIRGSS